MGVGDTPTIVRFGRDVGLSISIEDHQPSRHVTVTSNRESPSGKFKLFLILLTGLADAHV